jgi:predicted phosphohydrolase
MGKLFAIADLHLSLDGEKPMDIFGEEWKDHHGRIAEAWDRMVENVDTILLPGDLSWAATLDGAARDLQWIGERPGRKILMRGNHDMWWSSLSKVKKSLPERCEPLQNNSFLIDDQVVVIGARGRNSPEDPVAEPGDDRIFARELERLRLSIADADRRFGRELPRVAMLHYPPWISGRPATAVVAILTEAGVRTCVYGHLHGEDHALGVVGMRDGMRYMLTASDAIDFRPVEVPW